MKIAHLAVGLLALGALVTGCQQATTTTVVPKVNRVATFTFFDATTGAKVDLVATDVVTIQNSATGGNPKTLNSKKSSVGQIDITNDQFELYDFQNDENFVLTLTKTGYKTFEGHGSFGGSKSTSTNSLGQTYFNTPDFQLFSSVLIPSSITNLTPAYTISVRDANTKAAITSGTYVIDLNASSAASGGTDSHLTQYTAPSVAVAKSPTVGSGYHLTGTVSSTGTITIAAGTLFADQLYNVKIINATGYDNKTEQFTAGNVTGSGDTNSATLDLAIELAPAYTAVVTNPALALISSSNLDAYGNTIKGTRTITLTFNQAVEVSTRAVMGTRLSSQVAAVTANTDGDASTTALGTTALPNTGVMPTGLTVAASGSTIVITFAATDVDLTTGAATAGTLDTDDVLKWDLSTLFNNVEARAVATTAASYGYSSLGTLAGASTAVTSNGVTLATSAGNIKAILVR